jgi:hypothetical protein
MSNLSRRQCLRGILGGWWGALLGGATAASGRAGSLPGPRTLPAPAGAYLVNRWPADVAYGHVATYTDYGTTELDGILANCHGTTYHDYGSADTSGDGVP